MSLLRLSADGIDTLGGYASISPAIFRSMLARVVAGSTISPSSSFCARA